eukprot:1082672-Karenia_brevis.AAC.1
MVVEAHMLGSWLVLSTCLPVHIHIPGCMDVPVAVAKAPPHLDVQRLLQAHGKFVLPCGLRRGR